MSRTQDSYTALSQSLSFLRGWVILWIVGFHLLGNTKGYPVFSETMASLTQGGLKNIIESELQLFMAAGNTGVHIFLIISGFGLTASWWKRYGSQGVKTIPLEEFWRKRVWRILPLFWASVVLATLLHILNPTWAPFGQEVWQQGGLSVFGAFLATLTTLRNFIPNYYYFLNGAWWYVGLALQLYLLFPWLIRLGQRWGWSQLLLRTLLFSLAYRTALAIAPIEGIGMTIASDFFPARLFEFTFGIYLAMVFLMPMSEAQKQRSFGYRWLGNLLFNPLFLIISGGLFGMGLLCQWLAPEGYRLLSIPADALIAVGLCCTLVCLSQFPVPGVGKFANAIGTYSYGIYLTHMPIYLMLWPLATRLVPSYWPRFLMVILACCAVGAMFEGGYTWVQGNLRKQPGAGEKL